MLALSRRSGRARSKDVNATILNDQVHCGMDIALFNDAESTGVAAAPTIVDNTIYGKLAGPKTETAHPINAPLYPHRPSRHACLSSPIIVEVDVDVTDPKAAHAARVGSPIAKLASTTRPEVAQLRKITCPMARVAESRCSDCNILDRAELGTFEVDVGVVASFPFLSTDNEGGVDEYARKVMGITLFRAKECWR